MNIKQSIHRILEQENTLADLFYLVFLDKYPEVRRFFERVDMRRQAQVLTMVLLVLETHSTHGYPATTRYLRQLGTDHQRWGIKPELYPHFRDALLETLRRFHGSNWTPEVAGEWELAIDRAIATMLEGYSDNG
ncbi:MAG: globin domain-containing protein [Gemmataceae bacterium]